MQNKLMLTVNIVTYNHEKWIAKCLDSILEQETNFDFVVRIFDDISSDNTMSICQEYALKYPEKVFLFPANEHLGATENCLRAYQNINTKYYMYIEGDDCLCDKKKFQIQVDILEKHPECSVCVHNTQMINFGDTTFTKNTQPYLSGLKEGIYSFEDFKRAPFDPHMSSRIARTECINHDAGSVFLFDWNNIFLLLEKGNLYYCNRIMSIYNQTGQGVYSGVSLNKKFENCVKDFYAYDRYTKSRNTKMLHYILVDFIHYLYSQDNTENQEVAVPQHFNSNRSQNIKQKIEYLNRIQKRLKHYILPPIIIDICNFPRDFFRFVKKKTKRKECK